MTSGGILHLEQPETGKLLREGARLRRAGGVE